MKVSKFKGMDKMLPNMGKAKQILSKNLSRATKRTALKVLRESKKRAPVDFGYLKNSFEIAEENKFKYRVFPNVRYAAAQNNGSKFGIRPKRFMERGYAASQDFRKKEIEEAMKKSFDQIMGKR